MLASLYSCKDSSPGSTATVATAASPTAEAPAGPSIVGKWHLVDLHDNAPAGGAQGPTQEQLTASAKSENMVYEFSASGTAAISMKSLKPQELKYKMHDNTLDLTEANGKTNTFDVVKFTDKELSIKSKEDNMTYFFEKI